MQHSKLLSLVIASFLVGPSLGATITQFSQLTAKTFDYVIIGAGNAGLVLANRLSADPTVSVLVLEAGVSDDGVVPVQAPFLGPTVTPNTPWDWNYTIVPQAGMDGRTFNYPRGKLLGGSTSANYLFHQFGTFEDWNRMAEVTGEPGWAWSNMKQYIQRHERVVPPIDGHNTTGEIIPALHGFHGILPTSLPGYNQTIDPRVLLTTQQLSDEFPYNEDMSGGDHTLLGMGFVKSSAGGGKRSSSSTTYLAAANGRPNLTVLIHATVTKLIQTGTTRSGLKEFLSVQFQSTPGTGSTPAGNGPITVSARKEVILSAGSVGTAQILQLSGIGKQSDLSALGIKTLIDNPSVGYNLSDHTLTPNLFRVRGELSFDHILEDPTDVTDFLDEFVTNHTGIFANNIANNFGFSRLPANSPILKEFPDPAPGPLSPHWEMVPANLFFSPGQSAPDSNAYMTVVVVLIAPTSRGSVKIQSTNPFTQPLIDPNFLTTQVDIQTMRETVRAVLRFIGAPAWSDYVIGPYGDLFEAAVDDASIDAYVRSITTTIFHPVSTASMSKIGASFGVVDPDFKVKGASGLRIVDASVLPFEPSCHPQGTVYLMSERASEIIAADN